MPAKHGHNEPDQDTATRLADAFGPRLAALRKARRMSQTALAGLLNTSVSVISRYERGEMTPSVDAALRLADTLGVSIAYLLGDADGGELLSDRELVRRLRAVAAFEPDERERVYFTLDAVIREIQNRKAYAS